MSRRLRVTYVVPDLGVGGAERHVITLMPRLDKSRFDASVICVGEEGQLFTALAGEGIPAVALGRSKRQVAASIRDLVREFRRVRPDVVILRGFNAELLGRVAAVVARVPAVVVWLHHCSDIEPRGILQRLADRVLGPVTTAYFGVSQAQVPYMVRELGFPESKVRIVNNGVATDHFDGDRGRAVREQLGFSDDHQVVGILAALRPEKDHETFLRAAALVAGRHPGARFLVVGGGERRQALEAMAVELGIGEVVVFTGVRDDVPALLHAIDVFVLSSSTECFPMALLEAMSASRPAVCTAVGGIPEIVEEGVTGFLVPPKDAAAMAARLGLLLGSPDRRAAFGQAARARVEENFSLEHSVASAEGALSAVARRAQRASAPPIRFAVVMDEAGVGGVELLTLNLFQNFRASLVKPQLICLRTAGALGDDFRAAGFEVKELHRRGWFDLSTLPRLVQVLSRERTDAVLVPHHHRGALALGRLAALMAKVPVNILAVHGMDMTSVGQRCLPVWAVATLRASSALVLLSRRQGDYLHRDEGIGRRPWSRTREVVIPNGITLQPQPGEADRARARVALGIDPGEFVVGIVAQLRSEKAHDVLFEAFAELLRSQPRSRLIVVGQVVEGQEEREPELRALAVQLGIAERVMFAGLRRDVSEVLPAFDVFCLPSKHEGVPLAVIEAMAAGVPVVATDCGNLPDMVSDGEDGFIVDVGDIAALTQRLAKLAENPDLRRRQGDAARHKVEQSYQIGLTARSYERLLVELLEPR